MTDKIKFGTDGWRAVIGDTYTVVNVGRVAEATAKWISQSNNTSVLIGYDCRFNGKLFMETAIKVFLHYDIKVYFAKNFVSTPMVSMGTRKYGAALGVILTASHNPPEYGGFKLKSSFGGPLLPDKVQEVEDLIQDDFDRSMLNIDLDSAISKGTLVELDLESEYVKAVQDNFDLNAIRNSGMKFAYDAMYGAGQNVMRRLFPNIELLHCEYNPSFKGQAPEPIARNLRELETFLQEKKDIDIALVTDGDADRIGLYNGNGIFVDSHHIMLLLIHYMVKYKGLKGKVVTAFSSSPKIKKLCKHYGLEHETVKIGFKYIAGLMVTEDVLVGGEESGGIAVKGHIPERDGIWMGMILWEFMAKSGKRLTELIHEVYDIVGGFYFDRNDLHLDENLKQRIVENCKNDKYTSFGDFKIQHIETIDGFKFYFDKEAWVMIRPSGTEPVLRVYAEAATMSEVQAILKSTKETILN
ncbi:MAG: phosphoglucomutase/phosphomannomutase family protein [Brumimicrobium sp.]|nr:phosphoglucomutase/phosphomannomutase family protein [Brumimicrobium sp.]